jgi:Flp pilus assembly protein TadG
MRPTLRPRRGQALVEFAMVLPLLLALVTGIVDIGFLYHHQLLLTDAAREGARLGSLGQAPASVRTTVRGRLGAQGYAPLPADADVIVTVTAGSAKVQINSQVPFLFAFSGPKVPLRAATEMRRE